MTYNAIWDIYNSISILLHIHGFMIIYYNYLLLRITKSIFFNTHNFCDKHSSFNRIFLTIQGKMYKMCRAKRYPQSIKLLFQESYSVKELWIDHLHFIHFHLSVISPLLNFRSINVGYTALRQTFSKLKLLLYDLALRNTPAHTKSDCYASRKIIPYFMKLYSTVTV